MIKIKINGQEIEVEKGTTVLEAAAMAGVEVPHFCYHPSLEKVGSCRMCQVEFTGPGRPYLGISCRTDVTDGMEVETHSENAVRARAGVLEFLLANHPLDCPICDKAGECPLQDYTYEHGFTTSRFEEPKRNDFKRRHIGGHIIHDAERCILCTRCVRFMADYAKAPQMMVTGRGETSRIDIFPNRPLDSNYTGNLADICPVGALTIEEFRFKVRAWNLANIESTCPYCSRGCSIYLDVRTMKNHLYRVRPRVNTDVNGYYICNEGRFRPLTAVEPENRLTECKVNGQAGDYTAVLERVAEEIKGHEGRFWVVASNRRTVEELYLISKTFSRFEQVKLVAAAPDREEPDGILRTGENAPNARALPLFGFETLDISALGDALAEGRGDVLIMLDAAIHLDAKICESFKFIFYMDFIASPVAEQAQAAVPGLAWFEKNGTFINTDNRVQRIRKALEPPVKGLQDDLVILARLFALIHDQSMPDSAAEVFETLAGEIEQLQGLDYGKLEDNGALLRQEGGEQA